VRIVCPRLYGTGPKSRCAICLEVCTVCFPSVTSERRKRMSNSLSVLVEQIPYARFLQCQNFYTFSFVVAVEGRPERSSPSTVILPFLKRLGKPFVGLRLA
jgi:hypothetical protein